MNTVKTRRGKPDPRGHPGARPSRATTTRSKTTAPPQPGDDQQTDLDRPGQDPNTRRWKIQLKI